MAEDITGNTFKQNSLFLISRYSSQMKPMENLENLDNNSDNTAVPIAERNLHLQNVLQYMVDISMLRSDLNLDRNKIVQTQGSKDTKPRLLIQKELKNLVHNFDSEFAEAVGEAQLLNSGLEKREVRNIVSRLKTDFILNFRLPKNAIELQDYLTSLRTNYDIYTSEQVNTVNAKEVPSRNISNEFRYPDKLAKLERFNIVRSDPRAGFLPFTNQEKNIVLTFLSYLDDPHYPGGVNDQLMEVFRHQQKIEKQDWRDGVRALESKAYELGDFLDNAIRSYKAMLGLSIQIQDCPNPRVSLCEEIEDATDGIAAFARYHDLQLYINGKTIPKFNRDPTRTKIDRISESETGKRKVVEDRYTTKNREEEFSQRIDQFSKTMTIGDSRKLVIEALENENVRMNFYINLLKQIEYLPASRFFNQVKQIGEQALRSLE